MPLPFESLDATMRGEVSPLTPTDMEADAEWRTVCQVAVDYVCERTDRKVPDPDDAAERNKILLEEVDDEAIHYAWEQMRGPDGVK